MEKFDPFSYADQLKKYVPKEADRILVQYGWIERLPRVRQNRIVTCPLCKEEFSARNGRQMFCVKNSKGESCSKINKYQKLYNRRHS